MGSLYKLKGFTNKLKEILSPYEEIDTKSEGCIFYSEVPAKVIIEISKKVPKENLEDRENNSPSFKDFVEIAKKYPYTKFECYIITDKRDDERITINGIYIPPVDMKLIEEIRKKQLAPPEEDFITESGYRLLWWD